MGDGWRWQGRQYHMWFGHGTRPSNDGAGRTPAPDKLEDRIRDVGRSAFAALPQAVRRHAAATFSARDLDRLVETMQAWVSGLHLTRKEFAEQLIGRGEGDEAAVSFREAAEKLAQATTQADLSAAAEHFAAGMSTIGLDQWRREFADLHDRSSSAKAGVQRYTAKLSIGPAPYDTAAIDFDPMSESMTLEAAAAGRQVLAIAAGIAARAEGRFDRVTVGSASNTLHAEFAAAIEAAHIKGVSVEDPFKRDGTPARYGEKDSKRTDVIYRNLRGEIEAVWDWKVGGARLSSRRAKELAEQIAGVIGTPRFPKTRFPVIELHVELKPGL